MRVGRVLPLLLAIGLPVVGCASFTETWESWLGEEATPLPTPAADHAPVFYAATDGVVLYTLPAATSDVVARLALHQPVTRIALSRGFANVTTESGLVGWVDNTQLLWRLPATPIPTAAAPTADATPAVTPSY